MGDRGKDLVYDVLERLQRLSTVAQLQRELQASIEGFGLKSFGIAELPKPGRSARDIQTLHTWPAEWAARYQAKGYSFIDPVFRHVRFSNGPYLWSDVTDRRTLRPQSRMVMQEASEFGMNTGFTIPVRSLSGVEAVVTMSAVSLDLSPIEREFLKMIGLYAHGKWLELGGETRRPHRTAVKLTAREIDCIKWCAEGKSSWDIAQILGIAKRTVDQYLAGAARKLDCTTRTHLVAEALRMQIID